MLRSTTNWLTSSSCVVGLTAQIIEQSSFFTSLTETFSNFMCSVFNVVLDHRFTDQAHLCDLSKYLLCRMLHLMCYQTPHLEVRMHDMTRRQNFTHVHLSCCQKVAELTLTIRVWVRYTIDIYMDLWIYTW